MLNIYVFMDMIQFNFRITTTSGDKEEVMQQEASVVLIINFF